MSTEARGEEEKCGAADEGGESHEERSGGGSSDDVKGFREAAKSRPGRKSRESKVPGWLESPFLWRRGEAVVHLRRLSVANRGCGFGSKDAEHEAGLADGCARLGSRTELLSRVDESVSG